MKINAEDLGTCDYCLRKGRKINLARVYWLVNNRHNEYCPRCLPDVIKSMLEMPWVEKYGYKVTYPYRK